MEKATEDYVSYEVAKLLKEKGFDWKCLAHWFIGIDRNFSISVAPQNWNEVKTDLDWLSCPTHQMAMKWLRKKGIRICIDYNNMNGDWYATIAKEYDGQMSERIRSEHFTLYEEAVEAALKYVLENLI